MLKMWSSWPRWLRVSSYTAGALLLCGVSSLIYLFAPCFLSRCDGLGEGLLASFVVLPLTGVVVLLWASAVAVEYLLRSSRQTGARVVAFTGAFVSLAALVVILTEQNWIEPFGTIFVSVAALSFAVFLALAAMASRK